MDGLREYVLRFGAVNLPMRVDAWEHYQLHCRRDPRAQERPPPYRVEEGV